MELFQIRDAQGRLRTVRAKSHRAAVKAFVKKYRPPRSDVDVRAAGAPRNSTQSYRID